VVQRSGSLFWVEYDPTTQKLEGTSIRKQRNFLNGWTLLALSPVAGLEGPIATVVAQVQTRTHNARVSVSLRRDPNVTNATKTFFFVFLSVLGCC
jgi:hypothetical protein